MLQLSFLFCFYVCLLQIALLNFFFFFSSAHAWYGLPSKLVNNWLARGKKNDPLVPQLICPFCHIFWRIAARLHQVSNMFETLQFFSHWNCTEVAGGLHAWFEVAEWVQQRLHQKLLVDRVIRFSKNPARNTWNTCLYLWTVKRNRYYTTGQGKSARKVALLQI